MAGPPEAGKREVLSQKEVEELRHSLSLLSPSNLLNFYRDVHRECAAERRPTARAIQQLVTAWKILRRWNWK